MPIIEVSDLSYIYHPGSPYERRALNHVSLSIEKGEFLSLVGTNGSGKSTLIQHFNGLLSPTSGKVCVFGQDTVDKEFREQLWRRVGLVFQFPEQQLFEGTVYDELAYGLKNMGLEKEEIEERVEKALAGVGLDGKDLYHASPFSLSGGMMRRVAVASILAMEPEVLVLDEPTAGLDPEGSSYILHTIKLLQQKQKTTIILVSHCINELILLSDRIAVLEKGNLIRCNTPREVLADQELEEILLPERVKLLLDLKAKGWPVNTGVLTLEEAADEIARCLRLFKAERRMMG